MDMEVNYLMYATLMDRITNTMQCFEASGGCCCTLVRLVVPRP